MRWARTSSLSMLVAVGAISLPLLASTPSAAVASPRAAPSTGSELAELEGSDLFGGSVAISGKTAVVGAYGNYFSGATGAAYVFTNTATGWNQVAELKGSDTVAHDQFGGSVAISGTTIVVGAANHASFAGRAYVFTKTATGWKQTAELKGSDAAAGDYFGDSVAISGTTVIVGAEGFLHHSGGRAYVFTKTGSTWNQVAELGSSDTFFDNDCGMSVAISGTTVVVGAVGDYVGDSEFAGAAYVFTKEGAMWNQVAKLEGSDIAANDWFGSSVAISGTTAVVGAYDHAKKEGAAYVFTKTGAMWNQVAELKGSDTVAGDEFGYSVAISGTTAVVGAPVHASDAGRAYVLRPEASSGLSRERVLARSSLGSRGR